MRSNRHAVSGFEVELLSVCGKVETSADSVARCKQLCKRAILNISLMVNDMISIFVFTSERGQLAARAGIVWFQAMLH